MPLPFHAFAPNAYAGPWGEGRMFAARLGRKIEVVCIRRQKLGLPNLYWQRRCGRQRKPFARRKSD